MVDGFQNGNYLAEPMGTKTTPARQLCDVLLGTDLDGWVRERRPEKSWRAIAAELRGTTGVDLAPETLRLWFKESAA